MRARELRQGLIIGVLVLIALWLISLIWGLAGKAQIAIREARAARTQYAALEERRNTLQTNIAALDTPRGKDAAIRTAFDVAKPGEEVIVVVPPEAPSSTPALPWWQRLFNWF